MFFVRYLLSEYYQKRCYKKNGVLSLGTADISGVTFKGRDIVSVIDEISYLGGSFAVAYEEDEKVTLVCDPIANIPLFYSVSSDIIYVSDNASLIATSISASVEDENLLEFLKTGYVTENETVYHGISAVLCGEYVTISKKEGCTNRCSYFDFQFQLNENYNGEIDEFCNEYDKCLIDLFSKLIKRLNGRTVLLFLSAGIDSRTVAIMLKRLKYEHVVCVTYGLKGNSEAVVAEEIAKGLGYPFYIVEVDINSILFEHSLLSVEQKKAMQKGRCLSMVASEYTVKKLKENEVIPSDTVVITGIALDVLCGSMLLNVAPNDRWTRNQFSDFILYTHYRLHGDKKSTAYEKWHAKLPEELDSKTVINENLNWIWRNRLSKVISNDVASYELHDLDWEQPFWERSICEFWLKIPKQLLWKRYLQEYHTINVLNPVANFQKDTCNIDGSMQYKSKILTCLKHYRLFRRSNEFLHNIVHYFKMAKAPVLSSKAISVKDKYLMVKRYGLDFDFESIIAEEACRCYVTNERIEEIRQNKTKV